MKSKMILPCLRGLMGDWVYYSTLMTAKQISQWIKPVKDIREAKSLDEVLQRDLNDRKGQIAKYLLNDESRFFNSIVVGVFENVPEWFEFDMSNAGSIIPDMDRENIKQSVGVMAFSGKEKMFAIDGQHRVAGIDIAVRQDANKVLVDDQFSVIFVAHIDDALGMKRTRKLFSDINKNAKPVSGGDKIKIDEGDLNAIVTRRLYATYSHFNCGKLISLTESEKLDNNDTTHFTNLLGLYNTNRVLRNLFRKTPGTNDWDEENVLKFQGIVEEFYNFVIINITDYTNFFINKTLDIKTTRKNNAYLLYRPVGLKLLAKLYVHYFKLNKLDILSKKINKVNFIMPESPFNYVFWNSGKMLAREANQNIAFELTLYLLGDLAKERESSLLEKYRDLLKNSKTALPRKLFRTSSK